MATFPFQEFAIDGEVVSPNAIVDKELA